MDQCVIAGVGNVYRSEVLFRQRVSPVPGGPGDPAQAPGARSGTTSSPSCRSASRPAGSSPSPTRSSEVTAALAGGIPVHLAERESVVYKRDRYAVPRLRLPGADPGRRRAQPVLVRPLPAPPLSDRPRRPGTGMPLGGADGPRRRLSARRRVPDRALVDATGIPVASPTHRIRPETTRKGEFGPRGYQPSAESEHRPVHARPEHFRPYATLCRAVARAKVVRPKRQDRVQVTRLAST